MWRRGEQQAVVEFGRSHRAVCEVAASLPARVRGLNDHPGLGPDEGMLFPFSPPAAAAFHMDRVAFPIDIVFIEPSGRVGRIVNEAQPGSRQIWRVPVAAHVIELPGGTCTRRGIRAGAQVRVSSLARLPAFWMSGQLQDNLPPGYNETHAVEPVHPDRFRGRELVDEWGEATDQPIPGWHQGPMAPLDEMPYAVRSGELRRGLAVAPAEFIVRAIDGAYVLGQPRWQPDVLNGGATESAVVLTSDVLQWFRAAGAGAEAESAARRVLDDPAMLRMVGDGLIVAELADTAQIQRVGDDYALVVTRGSRRR